LTLTTFKLDTYIGHFHPLGEIALLSLGIHNLFSVRWLGLFNLEPWTLNRST